MRAFFPVAVDNVVDGTFVVLLEDIGIEYVLSLIHIFGVRGANGVIIITTKKAKEGQTRVNINGSFGFKRVTDKIAIDVYKRQVQDTSGVSSKLTE